MSAAKAMLGETTMPIELLIVATLVWLYFEGQSGGGL
jgi:hypothetical protein